MKEDLNYTALSLDELEQLNGGGSAWEWLGAKFGDLKNTMEEAVRNGYQHAGLFY